MALAWSPTYFLADPAPYAAYTLDAGPDDLLAVLVALQRDRVRRRVDPRCGSGNHGKQSQRVPTDGTRPAAQYAQKFCRIISKLPAGTAIPAHAS